MTSEVTRPVPDAASTAPDYEQLVGSEICEFRLGGRVLVVSNKGSRGNNEDCADTLERNNELRLVVADGVGGANFGEYASAVAVDALTNSASIQLPDRKMACRQAQTTLMGRFPGHDKATDPKCPNTVLVCADINRQGRLEFVRAGDARGYVIRNDQVCVTTEDDAAYGNRDGRTEKLGVASSLGAVNDSLPWLDDVVSVDLEKGDLVVLCSDGVHEGRVDAVELMRIFEEEVANETADDSNLATRIQGRIFDVQKNYKHDNFTLIVYCHGMTLKEFFKNRKKARVSAPVRTAVLSVLNGASSHGRGLMAAGLFATGIATVASYCSQESPESNPFADTCQTTSVPGKWTTPTDNPQDAEPSASPRAVFGSSDTVNLRVFNAKGSTVELNGYPVACLDHAAPRAVAAEHPTGGDKVEITDSSGRKMVYHFEPKRGTTNDLQDNAPGTSGDLTFTADGGVKLHCEAPVSVGCKADIDALNQHL